MHHYFYDFEFSENGITIEPISLGLVCCDGRELYLEFDFDEPGVRRTNPWVTQHVLPKLTWSRSERISIPNARAKIVEFIPEGRGIGAMRNARAEFWGYYASYDWVCWSQLWGRMIDLPQHFPKFTMDLQQLFVMLGSPASVKPPDPVGEHNALVDARWNRELFNAMREYQAAGRHSERCR